MKRTMLPLLALFLLLPAGNVFAEWDGFTGHQFTISRLPSPRAQALGKLSASIADDPLLMSTHPAVLGFTSKAGVSYSHSQPIYVNWLDEVPTESYFGWLSIPTKTFNRVGFGISYNWIDMGKQTITDETGQITGKTHYCEELATISAALRLDQRTSLGATFGYRANHYGPAPTGRVAVGDAYTNTLSALHLIPYRVGTVHGTINLGCTLINLNQPKIVYDEASGGDRMPLVMRGGPGLVMNVDEIGLQVGLYSELQKVAQSVERSGYKVGMEVTLHELITLRFGHYNENIGPNDAEYDAINQSTWGGGVRLPVEWVLPEFPLAIRFDVIESNQDEFSDFSGSILDPYTLYAVSVHLR